MQWITSNEVTGQAPVVRNKLAQLVTAVVQVFTVITANHY